MVQKKVPKERFRNFSIEFKEPLSNKVLETLPETRKFVSKYRNIDAIKINDRVVGLILRDSFDINYNINEKEIIANSPVQPDVKVIEKLKLLGERIREIYDLDKDNYKLKFGADFRYLESFDLEKAIIENNIIEKLQKEFKNIGSLSLVTCKFILKTNNDEMEKFINLIYPDQDDLSKKRLLIEADESNIETIINTLKK